MIIIITIVCFSKTFIQSNNFFISQVFEGDIPANGLNNNMTQLNLFAIVLELMIIMLCNSLVCNAHCI